MVTRRWTTWAGRLLIAAALVLLAPVIAHANVCDEETPGSAGADRDRQLPGYGFTKSYQLYQRARDDAGREAFQIRLREFVVFNSRLAHTRHLAFGAEQGFDPAFMADYEDALAWGEALCEPGGEGAYAEYQVYRANSDEGARALANLLLNMAYGLGHTKAGYEKSLIHIEDERGWVQRTGVARLHTEASGGYAPAQEFLAGLYARGHVVPFDRARAYYWYVRARRAGADVHDRIQELAAHMRPDERTSADEWLASGEPPWIR